MLSKRRIMSTGVFGFGMEWWDIRKKNNPKKFGKEISALLDEAYADGRLFGIHTSAMRIEEHWKETDKMIRERNR